MHGPDPEPVPEKLPGDVPEPERGPTEKPTPMYLRGEATPATGSGLDHAGEPPAAGSSQPNESPLIGDSAPMVAVRRLLARVAPTESVALICGEVGCGRERVAAALHAGSSRAAGPFVAVDCGALAPSLVEVALFGHAGRGDRQAGAFERARGGTLLLDGFTEIPLEVQARLLRTLETGRVRPVGGPGEMPIDVRVVAATRRRPVDSVEAGRLREDLYYRLAVVLIQLPPLRERREDILPVAGHFLDELNQACGRRKRFSPAMRAALREHDWPGNLRELRQVVERAFVLCDDVLETEIHPATADGERTIDPAPGERDPDDPGSITLPVGSSLADIERTFIVATLEHFGGDKRRAANALGCSVKTLYNKLHLYRRQLGHVAAAS